MAAVKRQMKRDERQSHEASLRSAEVRLWVCEWELKRLSDTAPLGAREDLEQESEELRTLIESERQWLATRGVARLLDPALVKEAPGAKRL